MVVYDCCKKETFDVARRWFDEVERNACEELVQMLVCNKIDRKSDRVVTPTDGSDSAAEMGVAYQEVSAKENTNVDSVFDELLSMMLEAIADTDGPNDKVDLGSRVIRIYNNL